MEDAAITGAIDGIQRMVCDGSSDWKFTLDHFLFPGR